MITCSACRHEIKEGGVTFETPTGDVYFYHEGCEPKPLTREEWRYFYTTCDKWITQLEETGRIGLADTMYELLWRVMFQSTGGNKL